MKFYTNWPTIPQIFINGKFVGGLDVVTEMMEADEFDELIPESCKKLSPEAELTLYT